MKARGSCARCWRGREGLQAFRVLSMDESTAIHPAQMPPPRTHVTVTPTSGLERAQVKWFNRLRGFGFLTRGEGTPDIFVHMETLRRFGITELRPGQFVLVRFGPGPEGTDGGRSASRERTARSRLALAARIARLGSRRRPAPPSSPLCCSPPAPCYALSAPSHRRKRPDRRRSRSSARPACMPSPSSLPTNDDERARGLMFRKELPEGQRHAVRFRARSAGRVLDAQHLHLARHDLYPRRRPHPAHRRKHRAACRTASFPPAVRCVPCSK